MSIVELSSRQAREEALKALTNDSSKLENGSGTVQVGRAKTSMQLKRNSCLIKAADALKKCDQNKDKSIQICWKVEGSKECQVQVDGHVAFQQSSADLVGRFTAPFED